MDNLLTQALTQVPALVIFVWYLTQHGKQDQKMVEDFNDTIKVHMTEANRIQIELGKRLQEFSDSNKELRVVVQKLYEQNYKLVKTHGKTKEEKY